MNGKSGGKNETKLWKEGRKEWEERMEGRNGRGPSFHIDTCFWCPQKSIYFGIPKSKSFVNMTLFDGGSYSPSKTLVRHISTARTSSARNVRTASVLSGQKGRKE